MRKGLMTAATVSLVLAAVAPGAAQAQDAKRHRVAAVVTTKAPPLTVTGRSWLDMGPAARVGTQDSYLSASTYLNQPVWASYIPDRFGASTLPRQFSLPSNDNPDGPSNGGIFFDF